MTKAEAEQYLKERAATGGPAFPFTEFQDNGAKCDAQGMTLRDYFAAHAPISITEAGSLYLQNRGPSENMGQVLDYLAGLRLAYADAMLEARKK